MRVRGGQLDKQKSTAHSLAVPKIASLSFSICDLSFKVFSSSSFVRFEETVSMTDWSWSPPMTDTRDDGQVKRKWGEYL